MCLNLGKLYSLCVSSHWKLQTFSEAEHLVTAIDKKEVQIKIQAVIHISMSNLKSFFKFSVSMMPHNIITTIRHEIIRAISL